MNRPVFHIICFCVFLHLFSSAGAQDVKVEAIPLEEVNTPYDEFGPVFLDSVSLVYASSQRNKRAERILEYKHALFTTVRDTGSWSAPERFSYLLNSDNHDVCVGMSEKKDILYVYKRFSGGDLYFAEKKANGKWKGLKRLKCNSEFHESSCCSFENVLYFTSDRPSGMGRHDIFRTERADDGSWSEPEALTTLNTAADENYVFISADGSHLFFSSDRLGGLGGYDVYFSKKQGSSWSEPRKIDEPINSRFNDIGFTMDSEEMPCFASDRSDTGMVDYNIYVVIKIEEEPEVFEKEVPIVLVDTSDIERNHVAKIMQIKDYVTLRAGEEIDLNEIVFSKQKIIDTNFALTVSMLEIDQKYTIVDSITDQIVSYAPVPVDAPAVKAGSTYSLEELETAIDFDIKYCKVQIGTFVNIKSISQFEEKFPLLKGRAAMEKFPEYNKFFMKETFTELKQAAVLQKKCLLEYGSVDDTFIGVYTDEGERILIYFDVEKELYVVVRSN